MFRCRRWLVATIKLDSKRFDNLMESEILHFSKKSIGPLEKDAILALYQQNQAGEVLLQELPVRFAAQIRDIKELPDKIEEFSQVRDIFATSFKQLRMRSVVTRADISELKIRHQRVIPLLLQGMRRVQNEKLLDGSEVDYFCNRFFLKRIGTEMLTAQFLAIHGASRGILQNVTYADPVVVVEKAIASISDLTRRTRGVDVSSRVSYCGPEGATVSYPPAYLFYILSELLKNSFRAHAEYKSKDGLRPLSFDPRKEPVEVVVTVDEGKFAIMIEDRGGGIPIEHEKRIWSYLFSTAEAPEFDSDVTPLAGFGVGLPLSRSYAKYLGGSLQVISLPNYGTHAFLFLNRDVTEN